MKQVFHKFWGEAVTIHAFITYNSHSTSLGHLYMLICFTAEECSFITLCYLFHEGQRKRETALFPHILSFFCSFYLRKNFQAPLLFLEICIIHKLCAIVHFYLCVHVCVLCMSMRLRGPCVSSGAHFCMCMWRLALCSIPCIPWGHKSDTQGAGVTSSRGPEFGS